jgi:DNA polymerase-4
LAKLASDHRKPDGLFVITPKMGPGFVEDLAVGKFHGVGPVTAAKMNALGIYTGLDLRQQSHSLLAEHFGKAGNFYYAIARGEDDRPVNPDRSPKSIGAEATFERDLRHWDEVCPALEPVLAKLGEAYSNPGQAGRTVTVKIKFADFRQITRSRSVAEPIGSQEALEEVSFDLLRSQFPPRLPVRLLGVTVSNFDSMPQDSGVQLLLSLF